MTPEQRKIILDRFLDEHNIKEQYYNNAKNASVSPSREWKTVDSQLLEPSHKYVLLYTFSWTSTSEGYEFWSRMYYMWDLKFE